MSEQVKPMDILFPLLEPVLPFPLVYQEASGDSENDPLVMIAFTELSDSDEQLEEGLDDAQNWLISFTAKCRDSDAGWDTLSEIHSHMTTFAQTAPRVEGIGQLTEVNRRRKIRPISPEDGLNRLQSVYQVTLTP